MDCESEKKWFSDVENIIEDPLKFKARLNIGEDAYTSLKIKNAARDVFDVLGASTAGVAIAQSSIVASTFFAPTGFWAAIGLGGAAATPIGWIVAAGLLTGGAWVGIAQFIKKTSDSRVTVIPNFINTPIDVLALGLFDLLAPLSYKIADADGNIVKIEENLIRDYFLNEWGYDKDFLDEGLQYVKCNLKNFSIADLSATLSDFASKNPDCNYKYMTNEIISFLEEVMESDGIIDKREVDAIELVRLKFSDHNKVSIRRSFIDKAKNIKKNVENIDFDAAAKKIKKTISDYDYRKD